MGTPGPGVRGAVGSKLPVGQGHGRSCPGCCRLQLSPTRVRPGSGRLRAESVCTSWDTHSRQGAWPGSGAEREAAAERTAPSCRPGSTSRSRASSPRSARRAERPLAAARGVGRRAGPPAGTNRRAAPGLGWASEVGLGGTRIKSRRFSLATSLASECFFFLSLLGHSKISHEPENRK